MKLVGIMCMLWIGRTLSFSASADSQKFEKKLCESYLTTLDTLGAWLKSSLMFPFQVAMQGSLLSTAAASLERHPESHPACYQERN